MLECPAFPFNAVGDRSRDRIRGDAGHAQVLLRVSVLQVDCNLLHKVVCYQGS